MSILIGKLLDANLIEPILREILSPKHLACTDQFKLESSHIPRNITLSTKVKTCLSNRKLTAILFLRTTVFLQAHTNSFFCNFEPAYSCKPMRPTIEDGCKIIDKRISRFTSQNYCCTISIKIKVFKRSTVREIFNVN